MTVTPSLDVNRLEVRGERLGDVVKITESVDLRVMPSESVAIVGESGSGKSITARAVLGLLPHNLSSAGDVEFGGKPFLRLGASERRRMRGGDVAFVMQDPFTMLNPVVRVAEQVTAALTDERGKHLSRSARRREAATRLAEVGISDPEVLDRYPFELSGGMRQRVAIAAAIAENPQILIADEPTTALDVTTQREVLLLLDRLRRSHGMALVLITHNLGVAFSTCDRVYVMYAGQIVEVAESDAVRTAPRHPYTSALLQADPPLDHRVPQLTTIPGAVPPPGHWPVGCHFAPRCSFAQDRCTTSKPELVQLTPTQAVRCLRADEIAADLVPRTRSAPELTSSSELVHSESLITMRGARKIYGTKVAVAGADIDVFARESVGLVGESGSGKTTVARMIVGLTRPDNGRVTVGGVDLGAGRVSRTGWATVRATAQMAFQDPYSTLNPNRSVGSAIKDGMRLAGRHDLDKAVGELLERVGLPASYARRRPAQLSGGERQRVAIARALSPGPKVVVCDEVVSALDVSVQAHILNLLRELQRDLGLTYVFITHDLAVVRQISDRVYVMNQGEIVEHGLTSKVLDNPEHEYTKQLIASVPQVDETFHRTPAMRSSRRGSRGDARLGACGCHGMIGRPYDEQMSIGVALERLAEEIERFGSTAYVLTVSNDARPHAVAVDVQWSDERLVAGIGKSTAANIAERPQISLLWPPFEPGGYSLIVDGAAHVDAEGRLSFAPSKGVLHRPAPQGSPGASDCVPLSPAAPGSPQNAS